MDRGCTWPRSCSLQIVIINVVLKKVNLLLCFEGVFNKRLQFIHLKWQFIDLVDQLIVVIIASLLLCLDQLRHFVAQPRKARYQTTANLSWDMCGNNLESTISYLFSKFFSSPLLSNHLSDRLCQCFSDDEGQEKNKQDSYFVALSAYLLIDCLVPTSCNASPDEH